MGAFRTIIGYNSRQYETGSFEPTRYLVLDTQEDKNVSGTSTIAQQPLQSGDTMSDHMYRDPTVVTINGMFSLNGKNWDDDSYNFIQKGDRLTNIQEVFEEIKDNGFLCRLTTIDEDDVVSVNKRGSMITTIKANAKTRFKVRNNMALTSVTWIEKQNTVKFTFKFVEVIMVEAQMYEELTDAERNDLGLPYVTSPVGSSLGTILKDSGKLDETIIRTLYDNGYINDDWFREVCETADQIFKSIKLAATIISVGLAVAIITTIPAAIAVGVAAATGTSIVAALAGSVSAIFPVGTIVVAAAAVIAGIVIGITSFFNWRKKREKQKRAFKLIKGDAKPDAERLKNLLEDIEIAVNRVKSGLTIYNITGNKPQKVTLNIGGEYYLIEFKQNNGEEGEPWSADVTDFEGIALENLHHSWSPVTSFLELDRNVNLWFRDKSLQYEVYLVNTSLSQEINDTPEKLEAAKKILEGYTIWVSKGNIKDQIKKVEDAIEKAIEDEGFV